MLMMIMPLMVIAMMVSPGSYPFFASAFNSSALHFRGLPILTRKFTERPIFLHSEQPLATKNIQLAASLFQISLSALWSGSAPLGNFPQIQRGGGK